MPTRDTHESYVTVGGRLLVVVALEHRSRINAGPRAVAKEKLAKIVQVVGGIY